MTQILKGNSKPSISSTAPRCSLKKRINEKTKGSRFYLVNILKGWKNFFLYIFKPACDVIQVQVREVTDNDRFKSSDERKCLS